MDVGRQVVFYSGVIELWALNEDVVYGEGKTAQVAAWGRILIHEVLMS